MPNPSATYRRPKQAYEHKSPISRDDFAAHVGKKITEVANRNNWSLEARKVAMALIHHLVHDKPKPSVPNGDFSTNQLNLMYDAFFAGSLELGDTAKHLHLPATQEKWFRTRYRRHMEAQAAA